MTSIREKRKNPLPGLRFLGNFIQIGGKLGLWPYGWDWSSNKMYYKPDRIYEVMHGIWFLALSSYGAFLIVNSILVMQDDGASAFMKVRVFYMTGVMVALDFGFLLNMRTFGQHHSFVNQLVTFTSGVHREFGLKINDKVLKMTLGIMTFIYFFGCINAVAVFLTPNSKRLLTSLWTNPKAIPLYTKLVLVSTHFVLNIGQFYHVVQSSQILMTYVILINPALSKLRWHGMQNRDSSLSVVGMQGSHLKPLEIHRLFNQILVLEAKYASAYGGWLLLIVLWALFFAIMNIFQAAVFHNFRGFVLASCMIYVTKSLFKTCGDIYEISESVILSWSSIKSPPWFRHYQRATRPARVPIGSAFYFDKGLMPTFMNIAVTTAANLIISYNG